jgi:CDP-diacylglycerol--serine O-phosphatidyltransferase
MMARLPRIPDLLTTANLACGMGSILLASQGQLTWACWLVFIGALFDVLDGLAARALGGGSPLGAQLDSLADMVTFGVAPAAAVFFSWELLWTNPTSLFVIDWPMGIGVRREAPSGTWLVFPALTALVLVIASAWRLAKFNIDTRQSSGFLGLPTPANGLFWVSLPLIFGHVAVHEGPGHETIRLLMFDALANRYMLLGGAVILAILMLSELPLPSLKFKHFQWKGNEVIYLLMGVGAVLVVLYGMLAVPLILVLYLLSPLWGRLFGPTKVSTT